MCRRSSKSSDSTAAQRYGGSPGVQRKPGGAATARQYSGSAAVRRKPGSEPGSTISKLTLRMMSG